MGLFFSESTVTKVKTENSGMNATAKFLTSWLVFLVRTKGVHLKLVN